ncbi:MAG TPA: bifunctional hydroxymethylpyrimidine kinase/phosphomethylpyrimidine kinase [Thermoanaerobaculia bacterium]|nr:bifunctional hydroxymethylpyrimidine kinase/phosphomethylpyrimidine kinase [Thermoanaerobaculia bacterium]
MTRPPRLLTIAGSDSGGGAGIQADLKTFAALGCHGMSVITAVTAQNTVEVRSVQQIEPAVIADQIDAVFEDIGVDAMKIGMLASAPVVEVVADRLAARPPTPTVLDPVMIAKSGAVLLDDGAVAALRTLLMPRATLVTPNLSETRRLAGLPAGAPLETVAERVAAARELVAAGASAVLVKGGHGEGKTVLDLLFDGERVHRFEHPRLETRSDHGTGCTLSAAIAAALGHGRTLVEAVREAGEYLHGAMARAFPLGHGHGPVHHFHRYRGAWS